MVEEKEREVRERGGWSFWRRRLRKEKSEREKKRERLLKGKLEKMKERSGSKLKSS